MGVFQTYLSVGRRITAQASACDESKLFAEKLNSELNEFNLSWQLSTGLSMEMLWRLFKPHSAKNLTQLEFRARAKQLANRFDAIQWTTGASVRDLESLRWSLIGLQDAVYSPDETVNERYKVRPRCNKVASLLMIFRVLKMLFASLRTSRFGVHIPESVIFQMNSMVYARSIEPSKYLVGRYQFWTCLQGDPRALQ